MAKSEQAPLISTESIGDIITLRIEAESLNHSDLERFDAEVGAAIGSHSRIVLDLGKLRFLSSALQSKLIMLHCRSMKRGGRIIFCCPVPTVREVFRTK